MSVKNSYDFRTRDTYTPEEYSGEIGRGNIKKGERTYPPKLSRLLALVGGSMSAVLLCCSLMAQAQLNEISNRTVELQGRMTDLRSRQARLEIELAQLCELAQLEDYAIDVLGMQKPGADQIIYSDSSDEGVLAGE